MTPDRRVLLIAAVGAGYSVTALLHSGDTLAPPAYAVIRHYLTEPMFLVAAVALLVVHLLALTFPRVSVPCLAVALFAWTTLGVLIWRAAPGALLPGYALAMVCCCGFGLFDALRHAEDRRGEQ